MDNETIFALSSGRGKSGVAVIRVSGDNLRDMFSEMTGRHNIIARHAYFTNLKDHSQELIDQVILVYFNAPSSFTGQDVIEIHSHGSPAVIEKIFDYLRVMYGARMATPGEFSRRAFYNNKMDLADIDGLSALLDSQTDSQRKSALKSMTGFDSDTYNRWRSQMIEISAYSSAILDYASDELPPNIYATIRARTQDLYNEITKALSRSGVVRALRSGFNIVLCGAPNVGKSSIFNYIVGSNRAIVSDIPGTTRDIVSSTLDLDGFLVNLSDTAGLRSDTSDTIEKIGIARTQAEIEKADLVIQIYSSDSTVKILPNQITVINKSDLFHPSGKPGVIYTSTKTGDGMQDLMAEILRRMHLFFDTSESEVSVSSRARELLEVAQTELKKALELSGDNYDIFAEHLRISADSIGKILGTITVSEIMDATFGQLCLGK